MKDHSAHYVGLIVSAAIGSLAMSAVPNTLSAAQAPAANRDVIVILRDQLADSPPMRRAMGSRAGAIAHAQQSVIEQLQRSGPHRVTTFGTINAFAATVSAAEAAQLATHPLVQSVVPDKLIYMHPRTTAGGNLSPAASAAPATSDNGLCGTLEPEALQLTQTAFQNSSVPQAQSVLDGNGLPVTGTGVKVAFLADGIDPNIPGFIRADGSKVFVDYQDFSGDPQGTPTDGGEAFGDASSIAAQDVSNGKSISFDISAYVNPAHPLPSGCGIHIRGMAPGASLVGLKIFSQLGYTTTSGFVQAIEYAVVHDDVDVINESFGGNGIPDTTVDPISLANAAAVKAGVTVTVSTGDAGSDSTLGSPSTDPYVIAVGASTSFRLYAQTADGAQPLATGYLSNNISSLSSGGFSELSARTVDVVAPGDLGWALCSKQPKLFTDCLSYASTPTPIQAFGGTSESSPLTAGEAALVIQAYRSTHKGADPSPALVKKIIMSTATDLGAPSSEQGAGLINSLAAVKMALSISDANGAPKPQGPGLMANTTAVSFTDAPKAHETQEISITNTGSATRHISAALQTLGVPAAGASSTVHLHPANDATFVDSAGFVRAYIIKKFTVPAGQQYLDAAIAWQGDSTGTLARISLLDPSGRQVAYSIPQGAGQDYGRVDVVHPTAGVWSAVIFTRGVFGVGYTGPVQFTWEAGGYVSLGSVTPASFDIAPGATQSIIASVSMPASPGDVAAGIRFTEAGASTSPLGEIPVSLRTLIPTTSTGGSFSGTLTGGNGRPDVGPTQTFQFDVPQGLNSLSVSVLTADSGYLLTGYLIDPNGMELSVHSNLDPQGNFQFGLQNTHYAPQPGRWQFVLLQNVYASGNQTSIAYTGRIAFNSAEVIPANLPNDPKVTLSASGAPVKATLTVVNTMPTANAFFADARLSKSVTYSLAQVPCSATSQSALLLGACAQYYVPTQTTQVQFGAKSSVPIQMDAYNYLNIADAFTESPDIFAKPSGTDSVTASLAEPEVPFGAWQVVPAGIGPYGPSGGTNAPVTETGVAVASQFDSAISADSGDLWADLTLGTSTLAPLVIASGQSGVITLTIIPDATKVGQVVSGYVYVDTYDPFLTSGDEMVRIPYSYTVAP